MKTRRDRMQPSKAERESSVQQAGGDDLDSLFPRSLLLCLTPSLSADTPFMRNSSNILLLVANSPILHKRGGCGGIKKIMIESYAADFHSVSIISVGIRVRWDHAAR